MVFYLKYGTQNWTMTKKNLNAIRVTVRAMETLQKINNAENIAHVISLSGTKQYSVGDHMNRGRP